MTNPAGEDLVAALASCLADLAENKPAETVLQRLRALEPALRDDMLLRRPPGTGARAARRDGQDPRRRAAPPVAAHRTRSGALRSRCAQLCGCFGRARPGSIARPREPRRL